MDQGNCEIIVDFANYEDSADQIANLLNMSKTRYNDMSNKAKEFSKRYSWDLAAKKIASAYKGLNK